MSACNLVEGRLGRATQRDSERDHGRARELQVGGRGFASGERARMERPSRVGRTGW
jgi:hypothetical protein